MPDKTLLIIDDHIAIRDLVARKLELDGFRVLRAKDGQEGLAVIGANPVDLVIVDLMMPVMDGFEFLRQAKARDLNVPIIVLSAAGTGKREDELKAAGATVVLAKPTPPALICKTVEGIIAEQTRSVVPSSN